MLTAGSGETWLSVWRREWSGEDELRSRLDDLGRVTCCWLLSLLHNSLLMISHFLLKIIYFISNLNHSCLCYFNWMIGLIESCLFNVTWSGAKRQLIQCNDIVQLGERARPIFHNSQISVFSEQSSGAALIGPLWR